MDRFWVASSQILLLISDHEYWFRAKGFKLEVLKLLVSNNKISGNIGVLVCNWRILD